MAVWVRVPLAVQKIIGMKQILIEYTGSYPCLCLGRLKVTIDGTVYNFPDYCLTSGGSVYFTDGYSNAHTENGPWKVDKWPDNFPEEYKEETLAAINSEIPWGCCGGCL